ncbi:uncharacterized protein LOC122372069 isoform X2 [Amphibalanus amphitrite]|nr:uncharacterized protein LOC122372069 isoform X2 [Amphibalanus amphitrite]
MEKSPRTGGSSAESEGSRSLSTAAPSMRQAPALCTRHRPPDVCRRPSCDALHICRLYVDGFCPHGDAACRWGHVMLSAGNEAALATHQLQALPERELLWLVRALMRQTAPVTAEEYRSQLVVCPEYAADARCRRSDCFRLHLCPRLAAGECGAGDCCRWSHRLTDPDNVMVLLRLRCSELSEAEVLARLTLPASVPDGGVPQTNGVGMSDCLNGQKSTESTGSSDMTSSVSSSSSAKRVVASVPNTCQKRPQEDKGSGDLKELAQKLNLCQLNIPPSHCPGNCGQLHLCRLFLADICPHGNKCNGGHKLLTSLHNSKVLNERGMDEMSEEELLGAIKTGYLSRSPITDLERCFALQVCPQYQNKGCGENCPRLHICEGYVAGTCANGSGCGLSHQLHTGTNDRILRRMELNLLPHRQLMELLKARPTASAARKSIGSKGTSAGPPSDASVSVKGCSESDGSSEPRQASKEAETLPLTDAKQSALEVCLCLFNVYPSRCPLDCGKLHLCRLFVAGMCPFGKKCSTGHKVISSSHNAAVLKERGLGGLSEEEVLDAIKKGYLSRTPITDLERRFALQICRAAQADNGPCEKEDCLRLHICAEYVAGTCGNGGGCGMSHQLRSGNNLVILKRLGLNIMPHKELLELLQNPPMAKDVWQSLFCSGALTTVSNETASALEPSRLQTNKPVPTTTTTTTSAALGVADDAPTLCAVHSSGGRCQRDDCDEFHVCGFYLADLCRRPDSTCPLGHSFDTARNRRVLERWALEGKSPERCQEMINKMSQRAHITFPNGAEKSVRMCIPYNSRTGCSTDCGQFHVCHRFLAGTCKGSSVCPLRHAFGGRHNQNLRDSLGLVATVGLDGSLSPVTDRELTELLRARLGVAPGVYTNLTENTPARGGSKPPMSPPAVCRSLGAGRRCTDAACPAVHVCPHFLAGACRRQRCPLGHRLDTEPNRRALRLTGREVTQHNHDALVKELYKAAGNVRRSEVYDKLRLCIPHNSQGCSVQGCAKIHICQKFVAGSCKETACDLGHVVGTPANRKRLCALGLQDAEVEDVLEMLRAVHGVRSAYTV